MKFRQLGKAFLGEAAREPCGAQVAREDIEGVNGGRNAIDDLDFGLGLMSPKAPIYDSRGAERRSLRLSIRRRTRCETKAHAGAGRAC